MAKATAKKTAGKQPPKTKALAKKKPEVAAKKQAKIAKPIKKSKADTSTAASVKSKKTAVIATAAANKSNSAKAKIVKSKTESIADSSKKTSKATNAKPIGKGSKATATNGKARAKGVASAGKSSVKKTALASDSSQKASAPSRKTKAKPKAKTNRSAQEVTKTFKSKTNVATTDNTIVPTSSLADDTVATPIAKTKSKSKVNQSIDDKIAKASLETAKNEKSAASSETEELGIRKARLIEKHIRQGKAWEDILKNIESFAVAYNMRNSYEARSVIQHESLGIGYVMSAVNNRMLVYFADGFRNLIMNYQ